VGELITDGELSPEGRVSENVAFPNEVVVRVAPPRAEGLAVALRFEMSRKNAYSYIVFVGATGVASVSGDELLRWFDQELDMFMMDYVDARTHFTGSITARVLSNEELARAIDASNLFERYRQYPQGYGSRLAAAAALGQDARNFVVTVETKS
jgi:hypothetical protein